MSIKEEVSDFLEQYQKVWFYETLANSYSFNPLLDHHYDKDGQVVWHKAQTAEAWAWWQSAKKHAIPEGFVLIPKEMSWQKADEIAMEHWNRYQYSHEVQYQGQNASSSSIELARLRWCKNKAHQIMKDYRDVINMVREQQID